MITARMVKVDTDLELCDVEVMENDRWVESSLNESVEDFHRRIEEFFKEYLQKTKEGKE